MYFSKEKTIPCFLVKYVFTKSVFKEKMGGNCVQFWSTYQVKNKVWKIKSEIHFNCEKMKQLGRGNNEIFCLFSWNKNHWLLKYSQL